MIVNLGGTYADLITITLPGVAVLEAIALSEKLDTVARLSKKTRADPKKPWAITVNAVAAHLLEDRGLVATRIGASTYLTTYASLTDLGRRVLQTMRADEKVRTRTNA